MLAYPSNITTKSNNPVINQTAQSTSTPNKRGCCQTKRRNYNLITSSNGIDSPINKSCCSKSDDKPKKSSCNSNNCSCSSNKKAKNINSPVSSKYTKSDFETARREFDRLVSKGEIRLSEYLEIFEPGSNIEIEPYSEDQVKTKLLNPDIPLDVVSRIDKNNNSININIVDTIKNKKYLDQTFRFIEKESDLEKYEESVALITFARWVGIQNLYAKSKKNPKKKSETQDFSPKKIKKTDCKRDYGINSECLCINHDMNCSVPFIRENGKMSLSTPCVGHFEPNFSGCCFEHDINLWCTTGPLTAAILGQELIDCFERKITKAYTYKAPLPCQLIELPLLWSILLLVPTILSPFIEMAASGGSEYRNENGKNSDSCLCGGDLPTFCCKGVGFNGVCRDKCCNEVELCSTKFDSTRGQGCQPKPKCGRKCTYFVYPNAYNPNIETLGSDSAWKEEDKFYNASDSTKILSKSDCCTVNLPDECTEKCFNCYYACKLDPKDGTLTWKRGKVLIDSSHLGAGLRGIPCCEGTPNENLDDDSNYCPEDYGKGSGSLPPCGTMLHAKRGGPCLEVGKEDKSNNRLISGY